MSRKEDKKEFANKLKGMNANAYSWTAAFKAALINSAIAAVLFFCCWGMGASPESSARLTAGILASLTALWAVSMGLFVLFVSIGVVLTSTEE